MENFLKLCSIVSIIIATIKLALIGNLSQETIIFIIIASLLILVGNRTVYIITAALAALVLFVKIYGATEAGQFALLHSILSLAIACFGLYIILRSFIGRGNRT